MVPAAPHEGKPRRYRARSQGALTPPLTRMKRSRKAASSASLRAAVCR